MWNKAYNVSVQMANRANKYTAILDAIEYGKNVLAGRPDNINITVSLAQVYGDKLGSTLSEKTYYHQRVRRETLPHDHRQQLSRKTRHGARSSSTRSSTPTGTCCPSC
jgi:hypothetical protein